MEYSRWKELEPGDVIKSSLHIPSLLTIDCGIPNKDYFIARNSDGIRYEISSWRYYELVSPDTEEEPTRLELIFNDIR